MKLRRFTYTKDNGDISERIVIVVLEPRENYLVYDVSSFTEKELETFQNYLESVEVYRDETLQEFEQKTGKKVSTLWRSFKPRGITWLD